MMEYINTSKELFCGDRYFKAHVAPKDFDYRAHKKELSQYFAKRGFKVSMMYNDYYSSLNGICSDRYISMDLYYMYILPCLNRRDMQIAYTDKNNYAALFPDIAQPETVVKNINGIFFSACGEVVSLADAVGLCEKTSGECIIKPTVATANGDGVSLFDKENAGDVFAAYAKNFIVQKKLRQHEKMNKLNPTSLNTLRIFTYRDLEKRVRYLTGKTFFRIGGKGACKDNGSAGGWLCGVGDDGCAKNALYKFKTMSVESFAECVGCNGFTVPSFDKSVEMCVKSHDRLPYFDLIGWDVAISEDGSPVFIEINTLPSVEGPQIVSGPFLDCQMDEIMLRLRQVTKSNAQFSINRFGEGFDYLLQIGG